MRPNIQECKLIAEVQFYKALDEFMENVDKPLRACPHCDYDCKNKVLEKQRKSFSLPKEN